MPDSQQPELPREKRGNYRFSSALRWEFIVIGSIVIVSILMKALMPIVNFILTLFGV